MRVIVRFLELIPTWSNRLSDLTQFHVNTSPSSAGNVESSIVVSHLPLEAENRTINITPRKKTVNVLPFFMIAHHILSYSESPTDNYT